MSATVIYKSHEVRRTREAMTATLEIIVPWAQRLTYLPQLGAPHPVYPGLRVTDTIEIGDGKPTSDFAYEHARFRINYSSAPFIDTAPITNVEFSGEVLETGLGRTWHDAETKCDQSQGIFYPSATIVMQIVLLEPPFDYIFSTIGKVNWEPFMNNPAETLLFEGCSTDQQYDYDRGLYYYKVNYRFIRRQMSHNKVWRAPRQARNDSDNSLADSGPPYYDPIFVEGKAGVGGWDTPEPPLYAQGDFYPLFGWPAHPVPPYKVLGGMTQ